ncbi:beta-lactamase-like protein [Xylariaceae sp. FL0016]|nr:beta-lactamase-like protein [Xylariaceae sp. FL0016]
MAVVDIPSSSACVEVSIINGGWGHGLPCGSWFDPAFKGLDTFSLCSYAFLVTHDDGARRRQVLFDLGIRKDWQNLVPRVTKLFKMHDARVVVEDDVSDILEKNGVDLNGIEAIVWSHLHWDHTGNPSKFPATTKVIVGPGIKDRYMPGWPANLSAEFKQEDIMGKKVVEISRGDFNVSIGGFRGYDYFGDGSFFLLDAPGHSLGHINALARTNSDPESYMFLAADSIHFGGEFRPSNLLPLPDTIRDGKPPLPDPCADEVLLKMHPTQSRVEPFLTLSSTFPEDLSLAEETIKSLQEFDADARVLILFSHDVTLFDTLPYFPKNANDWLKTGMKESTRWAFLSDLYGMIHGVSH